MPIIKNVRLISVQSWTYLRKPREHCNKQLLSSLFGFVKNNIQDNHRKLKDNYFIIYLRHN